MQIEQLFSPQQGLEKNKWLKVSGWEGGEAARRELIEVVERYQQSPDKPNF